MIFLDTYQKSLQVTSDIANLDWTASWKEFTKNCSVCDPCSTKKENQGTTTNGTVEMISAPIQNNPLKTYWKEIEYISVYNNTVSNANISVQINNNGTPRILIKVLLQSGYTLTYNEDSGWQVLDFSGTTPTPTPIFDDMIFVQLTGVDTCTGTIPGLLSYTQIINKAVGIITAGANTTAMTVDFGFGAIPVKQFGGDPMVANSTKNNQRFIGIYDGTNFQIMTVTDNIATNP